MSDFPENDVEIFESYLRIRRVRAALEAGVAGIQTHFPIVPGRPQRPLTENAAALKRSSARALLLSHPFFEKLTTFLVSLSEAYKQLQGHDFGGALTTLAGIQPAISLSGLTIASMEEAFSPTPVPYTEFKVRPLGGGEFDIDVIRHTFKGYSGQIPDLRVVRELVGGGAERDFRLGLLSAEISYQKGEFQDAINEYSVLLRNIPLGQPRHKFVALRAGFAHLGLGDATFRKSRNPEAGLDEAVASYDTAIRLVTESAVSEDNPVAKEIVGHATQQKAKIEAGLNYLGYTDGFVPLDSVTFLNERLRIRVDAAEEAAGGFEAFLSKANALEDVEAELELELATADMNLEIAALRAQNADGHIAEIDETLSGIADKQDFLTKEATAFGAIMFLQAATISPSNLPSLSDVDGFTSRVIGFFARANELNHQKKMAEIQRRIALREKLIVGLERDISALRRNFVQDKLATTGGRDLNADLYYRLAGIYAQLALSNIDMAIRYAFLFERAVAFKFRKPELHILDDFVIKNTTEGILVSGIKLKDIATRIEEAARFESEIDHPILTMSLRQRYPIEFSVFQQTGRMDFPISLYDLERKLPGTYDSRILAFAVKPIANASVEGYNGTLTHPGTFLVRDLTSTLDAATTRFIPTDEELAAAFNSLQDGKVQGVAVGGLAAYQLDTDIKQLSVATQELPADWDKDLKLPQLALFERYGATALWSLELKGLDPRQVADITFTLGLEHPETDSTLGVKVIELIKAYEAELAAANALDPALDQITAVSMRTLFPDEFFQLGTGEAKFTLRETLFPFNLTDLKLKTVIAQAINFDQVGAEGVRLILTKADAAFVLDKTTVAMGFTENIDENIGILDGSKRFPVLGAWQVRLADPNQFNQVFNNPDQNKVGDLKLLFVYEYKRV